MMDTTRDPNPFVVEIFHPEPDVGFWLYRLESGAMTYDREGPFDSRTAAEAYRRAQIISALDNRHP